MAQPSVAQYFNTRKRSATEEHKINSARKVLILDEESVSKIQKPDVDKQARGLGSSLNRREIVKKAIKTLEVQQTSKSAVRVTKSKKVKANAGQCIQTFLDNMKVPERCGTPPNQTESGKEVDGNDGQPDERCSTPPNPTNRNDKELQIVKKKILQSSKLNELKASIKNFKKCSEQLKAAEKKTSEVSHSPKLKTFKSIEFEVTISPQKAQSPDKPYLSPRKKEPPSARKNLLTILSPTKHASTVIAPESSDVAPKLKLPFKYRTLAEIFRAMDTICQMLFNRKETITFRKLKPAVEEMLKRTFAEKHLAQIKTVYPEAYDYRQEKTKQIGSRQEEWSLVVAPVGCAESMTPEILLHRRRRLYELLLRLVKNYHDEFLQSLVPPMVVAKDKITRWHPEFDLERVPDIGLAELPEPPVEEKFSSGKDVLEKARQMFNCNTRMEQALARLKARGERVEEKAAHAQNESVLKGIPQALLERVRQKQAAKALMSMTRSVDKDKEIRMYSRLPEIARLTRNLFVSEKKNVLPLDTVIEKLSNSYRSFLNKGEIEELLKALANEVPDWLVFHNLKGSMYLKLAKNADLSKVLDKLETLAKEKNEL